MEWEFDFFYSRVVYQLSDDLDNLIRKPTDRHAIVRQSTQAHHSKAGLF